MLHERLEQAESGRGCVVGLVGDPGAGKSRLLHEFRQSLRTGRVTYLEGRCLSNRRAMPYLPMLDIIRQSCEVAVGDSAETISDKVRHYLREIGISPAERAPYLLDLLGIKEGAEELAALRSDVIRVRTLTTLCRMLLASCRQRPVIVAIEDAQYIDKASEDCLASLAANLAHAPILLLVTYRPVCWPAWMDTSAALPMIVPPLEVRDSLSMIHAALAPEDAPAEREAAILERAAGNPLFLEELIQLIADLEPSVAEASIPNHMRDVLRARMAQLPKGAERLLQMASVLGCAFSKQLLEAVWEGSDDLETCLLELDQRAFCTWQTRGEERIYTFRHELVQEVIYESLPPARRRSLHLIAAQALETFHAPHVEEVSDLLAYHYAKTAQIDKAIESLTHLAETAARYGVQSEAVTALQEALAQVDCLPREQQNACRLDLILRQSQSLFAMGHYQETVDLLTSEQAHYNQLQDARLESRQALLLSQAYSRLEDWASTAQNARHALEAATRCEDKAIMGQACYVLAEERYWAGCPLEGSEFSQQSVVLLKQQGESAPLGMAHLVLGLHALLLGNFECSLQAAEQTRAIGAATRDSHLSVFADWLTGWTQATCGEWEAGIAACQHSLEKAPDPLSAALALGWLGYAYLEQGDAGEAIPRLEQAARQMQQFQRWRFEALYTTFLGEAYLLRNDLKTAQELGGPGAIYGAKGRLSNRDCLGSTRAGTHLAGGGFHRRRGISSQASPWRL